jgi:hypothetical protein
MGKITKGIIGAVAALVLFAGGYFARGQLDTHHFLYICPGNHRESNCVNGQEFEVFDATGAPIYSVGEAGGDAVFGDNRSVFPPNSVYHPP